MKKYTVFTLCLLLAAACGCESSTTDTRFLLDTVVTITAECSDETLSGAFALCEEYDKTLNAHNKDSEISKLNQNGGGKVSDETANLLRQSLGFCSMSGGSFDITVYPLSLIWNFKNEIVPTRNEIAEALSSVDYGSIVIDGNDVSLNGTKIDLGGIAKGYITDKVLSYLKENGAAGGIINLGGNVYVFGEKEYNIGIATPFKENETAAVLSLKNKSVSTSGVYQRYFKKDGKLYHHIIDPATGYPAESDLLSASVICDNSATADALSTICVLKGLKGATEFIESLSGVEAIFIDKDYRVTYTSGIEKNGKVLKLKN